MFASESAEAELGVQRPATPWRTSRAVTKTTQPLGRPLLQPRRRACLAKSRRLVPASPCRMQRRDELQWRRQRGTQQDRPLRCIRPRPRQSPRPASMRDAESAPFMSRRPQGSTCTTTSEPSAPSAPYSNVARPESDVGRTSCSLNQGRRGLWEPLQPERPQATYARSFERPVCARRCGLTCCPGPSRAFCRWGLRLATDLRTLVPAGFPVCSLEIPRSSRKVGM